MPMDLLIKFLRKSPLQIAGSLLDLLPFKPFELGLFYSLQIVGTPKNLAPVSSVTVREGREADLEAMTRCIDKPERFLSRFRQGDRCLLALEGDEVAGFIWFSVRPLYQEEMTGYRLPVPDNVVYSYDEYVSPAHRQKGILGQMFAFLWNWMSLNGKDTIMILIFHDNEVSWQAHLKKGFAPRDRILYLRFFGARFYRVQPADLAFKDATPPC